MVPSWTKGRDSPCITFLPQHGWSGCVNMKVPAMRARALGQHHQTPEHPPHLTRLLPFWGLSQLWQLRNRAASPLQPYRANKTYHSLFLLLCKIFSFKMVIGSKRKNKGGYINIYNYTSNPNNNWKWTSFYKHAHSNEEKVWLICQIFVCKWKCFAVFWWVCKAKRKGLESSVFIQKSRNMIKKNNLLR